MTLRVSGFSPDSPSTATWNKVRHALKFSLRRKQDPPASPPLAHIERQVPTISISIESDDEQVQENHLSKRKEKKKSPTVISHDHRQTIVGEETDQDDESTQFVRAHYKRRLDGNETPNSSSAERQEPLSSINLPVDVWPTDDENLLTRKQSKIGMQS